MDRWQRWLRRTFRGLWRSQDFRRLWVSLTITSFGAQITNLALPLAAALLLHATPLQMGILVALETLPFALVSLHAGVLLDRVRKLPIVIFSDIARGTALLAIPGGGVHGHAVDGDSSTSSASSAACRTSSAAPPTRCCSRSSPGASGWSRPTPRSRWAKRRRRWSDPALPAA